MACPAVTRRVMPVFPRCGALAVIEIRVGKNPKGSIVLFRFGTEHIVGHAIVEREVEPLDEIIKKIKYEAGIYFDPSSIRVYETPINIDCDEV